MLAAFDLLSFAAGAASVLVLSWALYQVASRRQRRDRAAPDDLD